MHEAIRAMAEHYEKQQPKTVKITQKSIEERSPSSTSKLPFVGQLLKEYPQRDKLAYHLSNQPDEKLHKALEFIKGHSDEDTKYIKELIKEELKIRKSQKENKVRAAGIMYMAGDKVLLGKRKDGSWAFPGGKIENGETCKQAARREFGEETGFFASDLIEEYDHSDNGEVEFTTFRHQGGTFTPSIMKEHSEFVWAGIDTLPEPLHPGVKATLEKFATSQTKENASKFPEFYYCRHMQPGVCGYENETILVDTECMKKMLTTAEGLPVYIDHQKVKLDTLKEDAAGYITGSFYNELDGWGWFKIIIIDDDAHRAAQQKWRVSNAYRVKQFGNGGTKNNVPYDREIKDAEFTHLAIVQNPRYEGALILTPDEFKRYQEEKRAELAEKQNSKPSKGFFMAGFKFFKNKREEVSEIDDDTMVDIGDGQTVSVKELRNSLVEEKKAAAKRLEDEKRNKKNEDDMVECEGEKVPMKDLIASYKKNKMKKNESETEEEKKKAKEKADKENAEKEEKEKKEKEEKENKERDEEEKKNALAAKTRDDAFMNELKNANNRAAAAPQSAKVTAPGVGLARGKAMFGSPEKKAS